MSVILQAVYRRSANPTVSVPAPRDQDAPTSNGSPVPFWYDHVASHMHEFAASGFAHFQLPPVHMTSALDFPDADGYGVYNEYDLGSDRQPTRFGTAERLQRLCAIGYANGVLPLVDWVPHQRSGGKNGTYNYVAASGKPGRFPKQPGCFMQRFLGDVGRVPRDPVAGPTSDDFSFGDELCPINAVPKGYVLNGLIDAGDWLYRRINAVGCRDDDTKGQAFEAVRRWASAKSMKGKILIGEYAEGNRDTLAWWCSTMGPLPTYKTYDFEVKYAARDMCNNGSRYDMRQLQHKGLASLGWPYSGAAVTFIENADSDTNGFGAVIFNKLLGYAWILTTEGWPSIYYRDYAEEHYCYGLKPELDNLIWIHNHLAAGPTWWRYTAYQFVIYERQTAPGLLVGLNNDVWGGWKYASVKTSFGPGVQLHDYTGHANDVWTDMAGYVLIGVPPNDNGAGYVCYSRVGLDTPNAVRVLATSQEFEGAPDLDILPATVGQATKVTRIWVAKGTSVKIEVVSSAPFAGTLFPEVIAPSGAVIRGGGIVNEFVSTEEGWFELRARCVGDISGTIVPFVMRATYTSTQRLAGS